MKLKDILNGTTLIEGNKTIGRKSKRPEWIERDTILNKLISNINFPVLAKIDTSYNDAFIYVNPKNRPSLDQFFTKLGFKLQKEQSQVWYEPPTGKYFQIKVKNKLNVDQ